jgi:hypothetical protein
MTIRIIKISSIILALLTASPLFAKESTHVQGQRFMPLPAITINSRSQHPLIMQPAKFFPLTQTRYPLAIRVPIRSEEKKTSLVKEDDFSPTPNKQTSNNKTKMSTEQAQQILSIFADNK